MFLCILVVHFLFLFVAVYYSTVWMYHSVIISLPVDRHVGCFQSLTVSNKDTMASLVGQRIKRLPAMEETQIQSLGGEDPLEKEIATNSSIFAWRIPWTEEPGRLQSSGSLRVGHDWATSLSLFTFTHWRRKWQPTPVFLPGESQGQGSLVGCRLWGRTELDTTEAT